MGTPTFSASVLPTSQRLDPSKIQGGTEGLHVDSLVGMGGGAYLARSMATLRGWIEGFLGWLASGKRLHHYGKSSFLVAKSTINDHFQ